MSVCVGVNPRDYWKRKRGGWGAGDGARKKKRRLRKQRTEEHRDDRIEAKRDLIGTALKPGGCSGRGTISVQCLVWTMQHNHFMHGLLFIFCAAYWFQVDLDFSKTRIVASRSSLSRQHLVTTISCPYIYTGCCLCPAAQARSQPRLLPERVRIHFLLLWSCNVVCMSMCACRQLALECE